MYQRTQRTMDERNPASMDPGPYLVSRKPNYTRLSLLLAFCLAVAVLSTIGLVALAR